MSDRPQQSEQGALIQSEQGALGFLASCTITSAPGFADGFTALIEGTGFGSTEGTVTLYENEDRSGTSIEQTVISWTDTTIKVTAETTAFGNSVNTTIYVDVDGNCIAATLDVQDVATITISTSANTIGVLATFATSDTSLKTVQGLESGSIMDLGSAPRAVSLSNIGTPVPVPPNVPGDCPGNEEGTQECEIVRRRTDGKRLDTFWRNNAVFPCTFDCSGTDISSSRGWIHQERARRY